MPAVRPRDIWDCSKAKRKVTLTFGLEPAGNSGSPTSRIPVDCDGAVNCGAMKEGKIDWFLCEYRKPAGLDL